MSNNAGQSRNWFEHGGQAYARFRPQYPAQLAEYLASLLPERRLAVDVGCVFNVNYLGRSASINLAG